MWLEVNTPNQRRLLLACSTLEVATIPVSNSTVTRAVRVQNFVQEKAPSQVLLVNSHKS